MTRPTLPVLPGALYAAYAWSLAWLAVFAGVIAGAANIAALVLADFVHGDPGRMRVEAVVMNVTLTPMLGLVASVVALLVFTLPQCFQAVVSGALVRRLGDRAQAGVLLVLPITAAVTWYCFDHFLPNERNPEWQHGLTGARYLTTLAFQAPATLFSVAYAVSGKRWTFRKAVLLLAFAAAIVAGGVEGQRLAGDQSLPMFGPVGGTVP